jgi:hypothetical protein
MGSARPVIRSGMPLRSQAPIPALLTHEFDPNAMYRALPDAACAGITCAFAAAFLTLAVTGFDKPD